MNVAYIDCFSFNAFILSIYESKRITNHINPGVVAL